MILHGENRSLSTCESFSLVWCLDLLWQHTLWEWLLILFIHLKRWSIQLTIFLRWINAGFNVSQSCARLQMVRFGWEKRWFVRICFQCRSLNLLLIDYNGAFSVKVMVFLRVLHCWSVSILLCWVCSFIMVVMIVRRVILLESLSRLSLLRVTHYQSSQVFHPTGFEWLMLCVSMQRKEGVWVRQRSSEWRICCWWWGWW